MKLDQSSVVYETGGFQSTPEGCHFLAQFQSKRFSEMTVRQLDPTISQSVKVLATQVIFLQKRLPGPPPHNWMVTSSLHSNLGCATCETADSQCRQI
jgi:hypothetical protein